MPLSTVTNKLLRMHRGFSVYLPGGSKSSQAASLSRDDSHRANKLTKPSPPDREPPVMHSAYSPGHDVMQRQSAAYQDAYFSTHPSSGAIPASTYPFSSSNTAYPTQSYSSEGSYVPPAYPYATPAPSTYDSIYSSQDQSGAARRPGLRRGDPYDGVFEPAYTSYSDSDPYAYTHDAPSDYTRQRRSSLSRSGSTYDNARQAFASTDVSPPGTQAYEVPGRPITRRSSDRWSTHGHSPQDQYAMPRPRPVRGDSGASWGGTRESALFQRLSDEDGSYRNGSPPSDPGWGPGSPGSTDSDFSLPRTPSPLARLVIPQVTTPSSIRSVRWDDNLVAPSPVFPMRRKGWFCRRGDQLWTNGGAYRPAKEGEEYPIDLAEYPDFGEGWMNEEGVRIDMQHCLVPKMPRRSALKRRESGS